MRRLLLLLTLLSVSVVPCIAATDGPPTGWFLAGNHPENYTTGRDGQGVAWLVSKADSSAAGFGTLMQSIRADEYRGKRVRFSATVRSAAVAEWAGLWMRVDQGSKAVAFDNMQSRPIKGTTLWKTYEVVLDVPADATGISFGVLVSSDGGVWMEHATLDAVSTDVPTTSMIRETALPSEPVNLDFRQ